VFEEYIEIMDGLESESNTRVRKGRYKKRITICSLRVGHLRQILAYEETGTCTVIEGKKLCL
jgi:hypothetical protein